MATSSIKKQPTAVPVPIDEGGTGMATPSRVTTTKKGISIVISKWGNVVNIHFDGTTTEVITKGSEAIYTLGSAYRPQDNVEWVMRTAGQDSGVASYRITTNGEITCRSSEIATGKQIYGSVTYLVFN